MPGLFFAQNKVFTSSDHWSTMALLHTNQSTAEAEEQIIMAKIETMGQLREFLCSSINGVANGTLDLNKAKEITKLASKVNESFFAEVKVARMQVDMGAEANKLGSLPIAGDK
jgi:hypothetical protein